jgi:hypothetical protein
MGDRAREKEGKSRRRKGGAWKVKRGCRRTIEAKRTIRRTCRRAKWFKVRVKSKDWRIGEGKRKGERIPTRDGEREGNTPDPPPRMPKQRNSYSQNPAHSRRLRHLRSTRTTPEKEKPADLCLRDLKGGEWNRTSGRAQGKEKRGKDRKERGQEGKEGKGRNNQ